MHIWLPHAPQPNVPPTPYVNQMAVNQHMGTQPTPIPPRSSTGPLHLTQGPKVKTDKVSNKHHHHPPPLHQLINQDLFVGTVERQAI